MFYQINEIVVSNWGVIVYCLIILFVFSRTISALRRKINPVTNQLRQINSILKDIKGPAGIAQDFFGFDRACREKPAISNIWHEFTETLLFSETDFPDTNLGQDTFILKTKQPSYYFSQRTILWPIVNMRFYNSVPNILTGLGILGTFFGLVVGIKFAAPGLNSPEIQDAKNALEHLLSGASLAFITSITGLSLSIIFTFYEKIYVHKFDEQLNIFIKGLEERFDYISSEKIASRLLQESQQQTSSLTSFSNDLALSLGDVIENRITTPMNSTIADLSKIMKEQKVILEGLRSDQQKASDETLERLIQKFSETISGAAGQEMKAFAGTISQLSEKLDNQIATMAQSQADIQKTSQESVQKLQDTFQDNTRQLQNEVSSAISSMVSGVKETVSDMTQMLQDATAESAHNMRNVSEQFKSSIDTLKSTVAIISQKLQEATEKSAESMREISDHFDHSITTLKSTINDMSSLNEGTQRILNEVDKLISAVNQTKDELLNAAIPIQKAAEGIKETTDSINNSVGIMNQLGKDLSSNISTIKATHDDLKKSWNDYQNRFEGMDSSLASIFKELEQGLATYASSTKRYVEQLDQHAGTVVKHLAGATSELKEDIVELGEILDVFTKNTIKKTA